MNIPSNVLYRKFKDDLAKVVNDSGLPAFVILPALKEATEQVAIIEQQQYERDMKEYEESLKEGD